MANFGKQIKSWNNKVERRLETAVRKIALDIFTRVIMRPPVDTGRFRGNWQVEIGRIPDGELMLNDKTGMATTSKVNAKTLGLEAGESIFLVNNLPYAHRLENGYSNQAPHGMVGISIVEFKPIVEQVARSLSRG